VGGYKFDRSLIVARGWVRIVDQSEEGEAESVRVHLADVDQRNDDYFFGSALRPKELRKICRQLSGLHDSWER
jgi:hypothetical protein